MTGILTILEIVSGWMVPLWILAIVLCAAWRRVPMYESFVQGAKEGFGVAIGIIPYLVAMLFAIKIFMASGLFDDIRAAAVWGMERVGLERYAEIFDLVPLALVRPLSGSGARGVFVELMNEHGPDGFLSMVASLLMGSTETTFYVVTVYFGAVNISKLRHAVPACLSGDAAGLIASIVLGYAMYGHLADQPRKAERSESPPAAATVAWVPDPCELPQDSARTAQGAMLRPK